MVWYNSTIESKLKNAPLFTLCTHLASDDRDLTDEILTTNVQALERGTKARCKKQDMKAYLAGSRKTKLIQKIFSYGKPNMWAALNSWRTHLTAACTHAGRRPTEPRAPSSWTPNSEKSWKIVDTHLTCSLMQHECRKIAFSMKPTATGHCLSN